MLCSGRLLAVSFPVNRCGPYKPHSFRCSKFSYARSPISTSSSRWRSLAMASEPDSSSFAPSVDSDPNPAADTNPAGFCIIEGPETVQDFATMELQEIQDNIRSRRNKIFLHMEEEQSISAVITSVANMVPQYHLEQRAVVDVDGGKLLNEDNDMRSVLRWQKIPADQRAHLMREKQEHLQKLRIENSMGSSEPTPKQISYLQSLGCTVAPTSRLHASRLIEQYKSLLLKIAIVIHVER